MAATHAHSGRDGRGRRSGSAFASLHASAAAAVPARRRSATAEDVAGERALRSVVDGSRAPKLLRVAPTPAAPATTGARAWCDVEPAVAASRSTGRPLVAGGRRVAAALPPVHTARAAMLGAVGARGAFKAAHNDLDRARQLKRARCEFTSTRCKAVRRGEARPRRRGGRGGDVPHRRTTSYGQQRRLPAQYQNACKSRRLEECGHPSSDRRGARRAHFASGFATPARASGAALIERRRRFCYDLATLASSRSDRGRWRRGRGASRARPRHHPSVATGGRDRRVLRDCKRSTDAESSSRTRLPGPKCKWALGRRRRASARSELRAGRLPIIYRRGRRGRRRLVATQAARTQSMTHRPSSARRRSGARAAARVEIGRNTGVLGERARSGAARAAARAALRVDKPLRSARRRGAARCTVAPIVQRAPSHAGRAPWRRGAPAPPRARRFAPHAARRAPMAARDPRARACARSTSSRRARDRGGGSRRRSCRRSRNGSSRRRQRRARAHRSLARHRRLRRGAVATRLRRARVRGRGGGALRRVGTRLGCAASRLLLWRRLAAGFSSSPSTAARRRRRRRRSRRRRRRRRRAHARARGRRDVAAGVGRAPRGRLAARPRSRRARAALSLPGRRRAGASAGPSPPDVRATRRSHRLTRPRLRVDGAARARCPRARSSGAAHGRVDVSLSSPATESLTRRAPQLALGVLDAQPPPSPASASARRRAARPTQWRPWRPSAGGAGA